MEMNFLVGWKELAKASGVHVRTLKRWHYCKKPIPYRKSTDSDKGRVIIEWDDFRAWMREITNSTISPSI